MSEKRRGLGRGIGALIPSGPPPTSAQAPVLTSSTATAAPAPTQARPVDVFFAGTASSSDEAADPTAEKAPPSAAQAAARALMAPSARSKAKSSSRRKPAADPSGPGHKNASRASSSSVPSESTTPARPTAPKVKATSETEDPAGRETDGAPAAEAVSAVDGAGAQTAAAPIVEEPTDVATSTGDVSSEGPRGAVDNGAYARSDDRSYVDLTADAGDEDAEAQDVASDQVSVEPVATDEPDTVTPAPPAPEAAEDSADDGGLVPVPGASFAELPLDTVVPNTRQPRQVFDEEELDELAASIREVGVLQPIVVRPLRRPLEGAPEAKYELIMGERRWRASRLAGNETVPAVIRETDDTDLLRDALLENLHRAQLNALEEAAAYQQLLEDFGCTHEELATRIARSRPQISNTLRLLKLPPLVQRRVAAGILSAGHARALLGLSDGAAMERLAQKIVAEGLSVRATEEIVALGDEPVAPELRRRPRTSPHAEVLNRLGNRLSDKLDTRVKVNLGQRKGRIAIEFASLDDLNRILDVLAPGESEVLEDVQATGS